MSAAPKKNGVEELRAALADSRFAFIAIGIFSFFVNLLVLTGSIYSLQVYDRVLSSRSEPTLVVLTVLLVALYAIMGVLDHMRGRLAARIGARFQSNLEMRVFRIVTDRTMLASQGINATTAMRDLDSVQRALASPAAFAVFDVPWTPIFVVIIFIFHPLMGVIGVVGGLILVALTWLNQNGTKGDQEKAMNTARLSEEMTGTLQREADTVRALGMRSSTATRWKALREDTLMANIHYSDNNGFYSTTSKTFRIFLQSAILGAGAWLAIQGHISSGAMLASSIIIGRALSPIEQVIGQWSLIQRALQGWKNLSDVLAKVPPEGARTTLPKPRAILEVQNISVVPPGERMPTLRNLSFELGPGQALGVIGQSGSGKSTLARVLTGVWPIQAGKVRLDGASIDQYSVDDLANYVGYLPQDVVLFEGTIAENIARLALEPDSKKVVAAAQKAAAHDLVLRLGNGYDTKLPAQGQRLSGGQKQRIGLARSLYADPVLLVLDEPNANLDAEGSAALNIAIRNAKKEGRSVVIMAHRPAAIEECDLILILEGGNRVAFGPRDEVLKQHLRNYQQIGTKPADGPPAAGPPATTPAAPHPTPPRPSGQGGAQPLPGILGTGLLSGAAGLAPPRKQIGGPASDKPAGEGQVDVKEGTESGKPENGGEK
ncbi:type I secretion system permease/ATPase [Rhizobium sp. KVB221]|uniref:Type I secretion system permease/ATPase n=1 Tax=Rhizobium setariae TaxID=2801340 RepID=A0A937CNA5_9HYPH|nr:type I secretion system permease/ATPase [Rhizobium setariae]MBL0370958.1 type I secretion system permease/ATPase [Rhizobium setariae]